MLVKLWIVLKFSFQFKWYASRDLLRFIAMRFRPTFDFLAIFRQFGIDISLITPGMLDMMHVICGMIGLYQYYVRPMKKCNKYAKTKNRSDYRKNRPEIYIIYFYLHHIRLVISLKLWHSTPGLCRKSWWCTPFIDVGTGYVAKQALVSQFYFGSSTVPSSLSFKLVIHQHRLLHFELLSGDNSSNFELQRRRHMHHKLHHDS